MHSLLMSVVMWENWLFLRVFKSAQTYLEGHLHRAAIYSSIHKISSSIWFTILPPSSGIMMMFPRTTVENFGFSGSILALGCILILQKLLVTVVSFNIEGSTEFDCILAGVECPFNVSKHYRVHWQTLFKSSSTYGARNNFSTHYPFLRVLATF